MAEVEVPASPATWLFHNPKTECFIVVMMGCKKKLHLDVVKQEAFNTLSKLPRFSSVIVKDEKHGKMSWRPTTMKIDDHIFCPNLDYDMNGADEFIQDYIHHLTTNPMATNKPLWELHLLNIRTSNANATGIFRIHHSVGDGISLISVLLACTRKTSDPECMPTIPGKKRKSPKGFSLISRFVNAIWVLIMVFVNTLLDVVLFLATILFLKDTETPIRGGEGIEGTHKKIMLRRISLDDIKLVKNAMNATINDVILGMTEAALSCYLNREYAKEQRSAKKTNNLPNNIRMRASVIFNIRPSPGPQVLADMMKGRSKAIWGNQIGYCLLPLSLRLRDDPLIYIRRAQRVAGRKKRSLESRFSYASLKVVFKLFGVQPAAALTYKVLRNTTICFSNVVGPQEEVSFFGHPISYIAPSVHGLPFALLIHYQSYVNKMSIVLTYDPDVISDPQQLCDDIEESLNTMKDAVIRRGLVKVVEP